jgi:hypothetical protein
VVTFSAHTWQRGLSGLARRPHRRQSRIIIYARKIKKSGDGNRKLAILLIGERKAKKMKLPFINITHVNFSPNM